MTYVHASNQDDICPAPLSNAGDVMLMLSSQNKEVHDSYSTPTTKDPLEGKTTAVIAVMRGKPKDGCHRHRSKKHYTSDRRSESLSLNLE